MGFVVWLLEADVQIPAATHDRLLEAIKQLHDGASSNGASSDRASSDGASSGGVSLADFVTTEAGSYKWVDTERVIAAPDLASALKAWRWPASFDDEGNVSNLRFSGQKAGDDELLWAVMAPFVEDGSYIVIEDEDGAIRRWRFEEGEIRVELLKAMDYGENANLRSVN